MSQGDFDSFFGVSEIAIIYKSQPNFDTRPKVKCADDAHAVFMQAWDDNKLDLLEQSKVLLLNRGNKVLGMYNNSSGGISGTVMDVRLILAAALKANASSIVLAHNHPSGNLSPSAADITITEKIKEAGRILDIQVLDHLILSRGKFYSFEEGKEVTVNPRSPQM